MTICYGCGRAWGQGHAKSCDGAEEVMWGGDEIASQPGSAGALRATRYVEGPSTVEVDCPRCKQRAPSGLKWKHQPFESGSKATVDCACGHTYQVYWAPPFNVNDLSR